MLKANKIKDSNQLTTPGLNPAPTLKKDKRGKHANLLSLHWRAGERGAGPSGYRGGLPSGNPRGSPAPRARQQVPGPNKLAGGALLGGDLKRVGGGPGAGRETPPAILVAGLRPPRVKAFLVRFSGQLGVFKVVLTIPGAHRWNVPTAWSPARPGAAWRHLVSRKGAWATPREGGVDSFLLSGWGEDAMARGVASGGKNLPGCRKSPGSGGKGPADPTAWAPSHLPPGAAAQYPSMWIPQTRPCRPKPQAA